MKKLFVLLLVMVLALSMTGCGEEANSSGINSDNSEETSSAEKITYTDDQILFANQNRADNNNDRYTMYYYNHKGELLDSGDTSIGYYYSENGLARATSKHNGMVGFIDKNGVYQIEPIYEDAAPFSKDGIALVCIENPDSYGYLCGYINSKGEKLTDFIYSNASSHLNNGYAYAEIKNYKYDEDGYPDVLIESKSHIIDKNGKVVFEIDALKENKAIMKLYDDSFVCMNTTGYEIYSYPNKKICEFSPNENERIDISTYGVYRYTYKDKFSYDNYNNEVIKYEKFSDGKFTELSTEVTIFDGKYTLKQKSVSTTSTGYGFGLETVDGEVVIPYQYDSIYFAGDYIVAVKNTGNDYSISDQTFDIYDKNCNITASNIPYGYNPRGEIYGLNCALPNGYLEIIKRGSDNNYLFGIIDYTGKIVVEPVFEKTNRLCTYEGTGKFDNVGLY